MEEKRKLASQFPPGTKILWKGKTGVVVEPFYGDVFYGAVSAKFPEGVLTLEPYGIEELLEWG